MRFTLAAGVAGLALSFAAAPAAIAGTAYFGLGDSITFGETDLRYVPSDGDRGYVGKFADVLAGRYGQRPAVVNLAIDGETADSFMDNTGRTPPVQGRTDVPLQRQNTNYDPFNLRPQAELFRQRAAEQRAAGNAIRDVSVTLGFNELAALSSLPTVEERLAAVPGTLATYRANYAQVLTTIREEAPDANLYLLGYYNPFPADPRSPAAPIFDAAGVELNAIIQGLAGEFGGLYVDTATPFLGREAELTYQDEQPHGFVRDGEFGGVEPIGNVHPNDAGYAVIAGQVAAVPLPPAAWTGLATLAGMAVAQRLTRRRAAVAAEL